MKRLLSLIFLLQFVLIAIADDALKIGVISDVHFYSSALVKDSAMLLDREKRGEQSLLLPVETLSEAVAFYEKEKIDVLLVSGDITDSGEYQSHTDFINLLKPLQVQGTRIMVVPGNHDVNIPYSKAYIAGEVVKANNVSPTEFADLYADCGYNDAISLDSASLSYVAALNDKTWLLVLDVAKYEEYATTSLSSARLKPETEEWMLNVLEKAQTENVEVLGMMHWGLVEHISFQEQFFPDYLVADRIRIANLLADNGVKAMFTGHFHANDITEYISGNGAKIYDIETASLANYPFAFRLINYKRGEMEITTFHAAPKQIGGMSYKMKLRNAARNAAEWRLKSMNVEVEDEVRDSLLDLLAQVYILHVEGDEMIDEETETMILKLSKAMDWDINREEYKLDFEPADNDVTLHF